MNFLNLVSSVIARLFDMTWQEVQQHFAYRWVVFEALSSESKDDHCHIHKVWVPRFFDQSTSAPDLANQDRLAHRTREFAVMHTSHFETKIPESRWFGIRSVV
jgi:hypothetical protein